MVFVVIGVDQSDPILIMFKFLRNNAKSTSLPQLDQLYGQAICKLSVPEKIAYCQRLIESSRFQLAQACPKQDASHLRSLIEAADQEIHRLNSGREH